ncbi:MAG: PEP-CTERM sorting domain-containing protein [Pseudomonadota bacterium]
MIAASFFATSANAGVVRVFDSGFIAGSNLITFDEFPLATVNPTYTSSDYMANGGVPGDPTVTFGGFFLGQSLTVDPGNDCPLGAPTACVVGNPDAPLTLDSASPSTQIAMDGASVNSPVLSGSPLFDGPVAVHFDMDLAAVGFDAGFLDGIGSMAITAYDRDGNNLGSVTNVGRGFEFLGLQTDDGMERIAGVLFSVVGFEPSGFAIDNLRFALEGEVTDPEVQIPEPQALMLFLAGLLGLVVLTWRRQPRGQ